MYVKIYMYSVNYFLFYFFDYSSWLTCANSGFFLGGGQGSEEKFCLSGDTMALFLNLKSVIFSGRGLCKKSDFALLSACNIHLKDQCSEGRIAM